MTLVYRFQNAEGKGPWSGDATHAYDDAQRTRQLGHSCSDMPPPLDECGTTALHKHARTKGIRGMLFGFSSIRQLKLSFPSSVGRAAMSERGQRLLVFNVPVDQILKGRRQCVFVEGSEIYSHELDLKTLKEK